MKEIKLTQGKVALVDDEDYEAVNQHKWYAHKSVKRNTFYAASYIKQKHSKPIRVSRPVFIMKLENGQQVDHRNNDGLNCQKNNLRKATNQQNSFNRSKSSNNTSGYKGVHITKLGKIVAKIGINDQRIYLGSFNTPEKAAKAYDEAAIKYFGEFAKLNFPLS